MSSWSEAVLTIDPAVDMNEVRALFLELAAWIGIDLEFQNFGEEIAGLPGHYDPILLARWNGALAGCVALRPLDDTACEMKRMFVRDEFRGLHIGRSLAGRILEEARARAFQRICLDSLPTMTAAVDLYRSLGFVDIPPYRFNPVAGTRFMEKRLV